MTQMRSDGPAPSGSTNGRGSPQGVAGMSASNCTEALRASALTDASRLRVGVAAAGGSLAGLQAVLGHSSVTVTERYGTISDDLVKREAHRLEAHRTASRG